MDLPINLTVYMPSFGIISGVALVAVLGFIFIKSIL